MARQDSLSLEGQDEVGDEPNEIHRYPIPIFPTNDLLALTKPQKIIAGPDGRVWFTELENPLGLTGIPGKVGRAQRLPGLGTPVGRLACYLQALQMSNGGRLLPFSGSRD